MKSSDFLLVPAASLVEPHVSGGVKQKGFVLIASLLIMVVLTILALSMFRSFGLQELMAGNMREKSRAIDAAQAAINYAEFWLAKGNASTGSTCSASATVNQPVVCSNAPPGSYLTTLPWAFGVNYTPGGMQTNSNGGANNYYTNPRYYIQYLGTYPNGLMYRITALGYGGNSNAVAVLQSMYQVPSGSGTSLTGP